MRRAPTRLSPAVASAALGLSILMISCTEDPLALGGDSAPGASSETRDVTVSVIDLPAWRDTTVTGFALPSNATFAYVSNDPTFPGRTLGRFNVPDTVRTFVDTLPVADFDSVDFQIRIDTMRSEFSDLPVTFRFIQLNQAFDQDSASWMQAAPGVPWTVPGGDLGTEIASGTLGADQDTVRMTLSVADEDSLMRAWQAQDGGDGFAVVVEGPTARVRVTQILLRYDPTLVGRTLPVPQTQIMDPRTFIVDPPPPPIGSDLRIGGIPASRMYMEFAPPTSLDGIDLEGATINHAELILHPLPPPPDPFGVELALETRQITLLGDPFVFGPKTPIGPGEGQFHSLTPELLASGEPLALDITLIIAGAVREGTSTLRLGLRGDPDAQALGYWEFGSAESLAAFRPQLRIVFSPRPSFGLP